MQKTDMLLGLLRERGKRAGHFNAFTDNCITPTLRHMVAFIEMMARY